MEGELGRRPVGAAGDAEATLRVLRDAETNFHAAGEPHQHPACDGLEFPNAERRGLRAPVSVVERHLDDDERHRTGEQRRDADDPGHRRLLLLVTGDE